MIPIGETKDGRADMTNFELDLFDVKFTRKPSDEYCKKSCNIPPACLPITILALLITLVFVVPIINEDNAGMVEPEGSSIRKYERTGICTEKCKIQLVESIPTGVSLSPYHMSTHSAWIWLMENAEKTMDLAALYWDLRDDLNHSSSQEGRDIFNGLENTAKHGVKIRIAQNGNGFENRDSEYLRKKELASVQSLNFTYLFGSGVLHTKFWIVDKRHIYLGSANMDWKSLTQVKELGVLISNCTCLAWELTKIFTTYWRVGNEGSVPPVWPLNLRTKFNAKSPLKVDFGTEQAMTFISNSPAQLNPKGREHDLSAILFCMERATKFIKISVMDYLPASVYMGKNNSFWPPLDNAIRSAAFRGIRVDLMVSQWEHTKKEMIYYLRSLMQINEALPMNPNKRRGSINIKFFKLPSSHEKIPFTRVNHNKYMVTDNTAYIGTSNWTADYFNTTAGVGLVIEKLAEKDSVVDQLNKIFERDWNSQYTYPVK